MSKEDPEPFYFEKQATELKARFRKLFSINSLFEKDTQHKSLTCALKDAGVPNCDEVAAVCSEKAQAFDAEKRLKLSFVVAYTYGPGEGDKWTDTPFYKINKALLDGSYLSMFPVRGLIWGLFQGLRTLPYKQFDSVYRALKSSVPWKTGRTWFWPCFTSATKNLDTAETSLTVSETGKKEGTLMIIENGWGYDLEEVELARDGNEVLMEPGLKMYIRRIVPSYFEKVFLSTREEREDILLDRVPRHDVDGNVDVGGKEKDDYLRAMELKKNGKYEECFEILTCFRLHDYQEEIEYAIMFMFGDHSKDMDVGFDLLSDYERYEDGRVFYGLGVCYQMEYGTDPNLRVSNISSNHYFVDTLWHFTNVMTYRELNGMFLRRHGKDMNM